MAGYFYESAVFWQAFRRAKIQLDGRNTQPYRLVNRLIRLFIVRLLSSYLYKVFIFLHSYKNRSNLFDFLKFVASVYYPPFSDAYL